MSTLWFNIMFLIMINNTIILVYEYYIIYYEYYITILWIPDYCFKYSVVHGLTVDVCAEINLAHIVILEDCRVSSVWCVVSSTVIQWAPGRKRQPCVQTVFFDQLPTAVLQPLAEPEKTWKRYPLWAVANTKNNFGLDIHFFYKEHHFSWYFQIQLELTFSILTL